MARVLQMRLGRDEDTAIVRSIRRFPLAVVLALVLLGNLVAMASPARAAFPGTNGKIAFQTDRTGTSQVFTMNADGTSPVQLTKVNKNSYDAAWYPDGTGLAFSNCCPSGTTQLEIYAINANGSGTTRVTNNTSRDALPVWSPDGTQIAFVASRDGNKEIYVMNADGTGQTNLTKNSATDDAPAWSPDGTWMYFSAHIGNGITFSASVSDASRKTQKDLEIGEYTDPESEQCARRVVGQLGTAAGLYRGRERGPGDLC